MPGGGKEERETAETGRETDQEFRMCVVVICIGAVVGGIAGAGNVILCVVGVPVGDGSSRTALWWNFNPPGLSK